MPIFESHDAQMLSSGPFQCQKLVFTQRVAQHAAFTDPVVAASLRLSAGTHIPKSDVSSALVAQCSPRRHFCAPTSWLPSAATSACLSRAPAALHTQPIAFSSLGHTESSASFALLGLELSRFGAFYSKG